MSAPDDVDNPATMTGPSYRGTGTANRGTGNTGTAGRVGGDRVAQAGPRVQAVPPTASLRDFLAAARLELENASAMRQEEASASKTLDELLPHFTGVFTNDRNSQLYNPTIGKRFPVRVLDEAAFGAESDKEMWRQWREDYDVMFRHAFANFEKKFEGRLRGGSMVADYAGKIPAKLSELHFEDAQGIWPPVGVGSPGGFWSVGKQTLFLKQGQLTDGLVAHELCHAYASQPWDTALVLMAVWDLGAWATRVDEAVTSELANLVLRQRFSAANSTRAGRRDGYHGYGDKVRAQGRAFLDLVEGVGNEPGHATKAAYAGGSVSVAIRPSKPRLSTITISNKRFVLDKLFI